MKKKWCETWIFLIVLIQIFLLINFSTAESYLISEWDEKDDKVIEEKIKINALLNFFISLISIKQIGSVSALEEGCCPLTRGGAICQDVSLDYRDCDVSVVPSSCDYVSSCLKGCCIDNSEGVCSPNSPKVKCDEDGGEWKPDKACNIQECQKGCCILGRDSQWVNEARCRFLTATRGFREMNFNQHVSGAECLRMGREQKHGACVLYEGNCRFSIEADCLDMQGDFYENKLCSASELGTNCIRQSSVGCADGRDEIYWFDSCGNRENIYSSDKSLSWNNGNVLSKVDSCNPNSANINSANCGNCNFFLGSRCSLGVSGNRVADGNFVCRDMNCIDSNGVKRLNGESWCVYDGYIGDGKDVVGSRHWKQMCINGEVKVEPCADFRQQICGERKIEEEGIEKTIAQCRTNRWRNCITINTADEEAGELGEGVTKEEFCKEDFDCRWEEIKIRDSGVNYCLPHYPSGLNFWEIGEGEANRFGISEKKETSAEEICSIASQKCDVIYVKKPLGSWRCVQNCHCRNAKYTEDMNDFCVSLGDCGAYVNIKEEITTGGYSISGHKSKKLTESYLNSLKTFTRIIPGKTADFLELIIYDYTGWDRYNLLKGRQSGRFKNDWVFVFIGGVFYPLFAGKTRKRIIEFECLPWEMPTERQKCEECNDNPLKPCTEYRCKSLGAACELINLEKQNPDCIETNLGDITPPVISLEKVKELFWDFTTEEYKIIPGERGARVEANDEECIPEFTPIIFEFETDEFAQCRIDFERKASFDEMSSYLGGNSLFSKNHTMVINIPSIQSLFSLIEIEYENYEDESGGGGTSEDDEDFEEEISPEEAKRKIRNLFADFNIYVRCKDVRGNKNIEEYNVNFCIRDGPDLTPPIIIAEVPPSNSFTPHNKEEIRAQFLLSEPAECKWSRDSSKRYDDMENNMDCDYDFFDIFGVFANCSTTLANMEIGENNFYILCKDQPWLVGTSEEDKRNLNAQPYNYKLIRTETPLEIISINPSGNIITGYEPITIKLEAKTSGGAENGKAICEYFFTEQKWRDFFFQTDSKEHSQTFTSIMEGDYNVQVRCSDIGNNIAEKETSFKVEVVDKIAPKIIRMYREGGNLKIVTDKKAECAYDLFRCSFDFENGTSMTTGYSIFHNAEWKNEITYYTRCRDIWGNTQSGCTMIIRPSLL